MKDTVVIYDNEIISKTSCLGGGGLEVTKNITVSLMSNVISKNTSAYGRGIEIDQANLNASGKFVRSNNSSSAIIISGDY